MFLTYWWYRRPSDELTLHLAEYGTHNHWTDVLVPLKSFLRGNKIEAVRVHHETFSVPDPFYHQKKFLKVGYSIGNGRKREIIVRENEALTLPEDKAGLPQPLS